MLAMVWSNDAPTVDATHDIDHNAQENKSRSKNDVMETKSMSRRRTLWATSCTVICAFGIAACSGGPTSGPAAQSTVPARNVVYRFGNVGNRGKIAALQLDKPSIVSGIIGTVVQIATSNSDGYALTSSGTVWGWGVGSYGELGDGTAPPYGATAVKVDFPPGIKITSLANPMPFDGALAIDSLGHAWGWGLNVGGDLCLSGLKELRPDQIALSDVTLATGARTHSLIESKGHVYACGSGEDGVLGNGSDTNSSKPTAVVGLPATANVTALTSSWGGSGALLSNGSYYDWGYNAAGQLGDGSTANSDVPVEVKLPDPVRRVSQGGSGETNGQTIAILANGSVWVWGNNKRGQLGDGSRADSEVPMSLDVPAGVRFVEVDSGGDSCYAIDNTGRLWVWGGNESGQLGTGNGPSAETKPVDVGIHLTQVSSTASNVAGLE